MSRARITRRAWLGGVVLGAVGCAGRSRHAPRSYRAATSSPATLRVALLHLDPVVGALSQNTRAVARALRVAANARARWAVTCELALTGYYFERAVGTRWIEQGPDAYVRRLQAEAASLGVALFLGHVERSASGDCHNALFISDSRGTSIGVHHKLNTIPRAEDWAAPGSQARVFSVDGVRVGPLICADAWPKEHARSLKEQGAEVLVSAATWPPGQYGPGTAWETRSAETGLPLFVANRTGVEGSFDMRRATSVLASSGRRLFSHAATKPFVAVLEWDRRARTLRGQRIVPVG